MIRRLFEFHSRIVLARYFEESQRDRESYFEQYYVIDLWMFKLEVLFRWDDHSKKKTRDWETIDFRALTRQLHYIVQSEMRSNYEKNFLSYFCERVTQKLFIISQYDYDKLFVLYKSFKHHDVRTQQNIKNMNDFEKTNWFILRVSSQYAKILQIALKDKIDRHQSYKKIIKRQIRNLRMIVVVAFFDRWDESVVKNFLEMRIRLHLEFVDFFHIDVDIQREQINDSDNDEIEINQKSK